MEDIRSVVARFQTRELEIRRRLVSDSRFRAVCADFEEASRALQLWQERARDGHRKADEYAAFLDQLGAEILAALGPPASHGPPAPCREGPAQGPAHQGEAPTPQSSPPANDPLERRKT